METLSVLLALYWLLVKETTGGFLLQIASKAGLWCETSSVGNSHRSVSPRPTTLEEDRELFVNFLWFYVYDLRFKTWGAYNFFDWISNTGNKLLNEKSNCWWFDTWQCSSSWPCGSHWTHKVTRYIQQRNNNSYSVTRWPFPMRICN